MSTQFSTERIETGDLRVFTDGAERSHVYVSGEYSSICVSHRLWAESSKDLPRLDVEDVPEDLCEICGDYLDRAGRL